MKDKIEICEQFIAERFPKAWEDYKQEWRERFNKGTEWLHADNKSREVLRAIAPEYYANR